MAALQTVEHIDRKYDGYEPHLFVDQNAATMYQCGMYVMYSLYFSALFNYVKYPLTTKKYIV